MSHSLTQINKDEIICLLSDDGAESDAAAAAEDDNSNRNVPPPRDKPNNARNSEADDQAVIESDEDDDNKNSARLRKSSPFVAFTDKVKPKEQSTKASSSSSKENSGTFAQAPAEAASGAAAASEDMDDVDISNIPEMEQMKMQCWACCDALRLPNGEFSFYTTHEHPLFQGVPCCSLCADAIATLVEDAENNKHKDVEDEDDDDDDVCVACTESRDQLVICDACEMEYCTLCLAKAHGGGLAGWDHVQKHVLQNKSDEAWECPACAQTEFLLNFSQVVTDEQNQFQQDRTAVTAIENLQQVHYELQRALEELDERGAKQDEILEELQSEIKDEDKLKLAVEEELTLWEENLQRHCQRVQAHEASLQDEIETVFGIDLSRVYQDYLGIPRPVVSAERDPKWVEEANLELNRKLNHQRKKSPFVPANFEDNYDHVEELTDTDEDVPQSLGADKRSGFASSQERFPADYVAEVKRYEDEKLAKDGKQVPRDKRVTEKTDKTDAEKEEIKISKSGIRSEQRMIVQSRRHKRKGGNSNRGATAKKSSKLDADSVSKPFTHPRGAEFGAEETYVPNALRGRPLSPLVTNEPPSLVVRKKKRSVPPKDNATESKRLKCGSREADHGAPGLAQGNQANVDSPSRNRKQNGKKIIFDRAFIHKKLQDDLKDHQIEGAKFMWQNFFAPAEHLQPGGCILAHTMGLGKTLTSLAFLSASMDQGLLETVLLVVPTNTIWNWEREFYDWIGKLRENTITLENLDDAKASMKSSVVEKFMRKRRNGPSPRCLLVSHGTLAKIVDQVAHVDAVVIDEAHLPLNNDSTERYKALTKLRTSLRIGLTGTPIQNNLMEYYNMLQFIRPDFLGEKATFEREYAEPIKAGMAKDCTDAAAQESRRKSYNLFKMLKPIVNRKDAAFLKNDLPALQQVVLHIRPSKLQASIQRSFAVTRGNHEEFRNFFTAFKALAPINNHPANVLHKTDDDNRVESPVKTWWDKLRRKYGEEEIRKIDSGYKLVLLLHILVLAEQKNEKVLIFSGCLKTLDLVQEILGRQDWAAMVPGLPVPEGTNVGGWQNGKDFYRIDGGVQSEDRGKSVHFFQKSERARAFLLSSKAGGIGINLTAASRVVLLDTDFNPTITHQAIFRCYRYGQEKEVFVYRFLAAGTMEEKVFARCVNKTGMSMRVIDSKAIKRDFTERELNDLQSTLNWIQCEKCDKWRVVYDQDVKEEDLPKNWVCAMNSDPKNNLCSHPERDQAWYEAELSGKNAEAEDEVVVVESLGSEETDVLVQKDDILQHILNVKNNRGTDIVCKYKFQDSLLDAKDLGAGISINSEQVSVKVEPNLSDAHLMSGQSSCGIAETEEHQKSRKPTLSKPTQKLETKSNCSVSDVTRTSSMTASFSIKKPTQEVDKTLSQKKKTSTSTNGTRNSGIAVSSAVNKPTQQREVSSSTKNSYSTAKNDEPRNPGTAATVPAEQPNKKIDSSPSQSTKNNLSLSNNGPARNLGLSPSKKNRTVEHQPEQPSPTRSGRWVQPTNFFLKESQSKSESWGSLKSKPNETNTDGCLKLAARKRKPQGTGKNALSKSEKVRKVKVSSTGIPLVKQKNNTNSGSTKKMLQEGLQKERKLADGGGLETAICIDSDDDELDIVVEGHEKRGAGPDDGQDSSVTVDPKYADDVFTC